LWPQPWKLVKEFVKSCDTYARSKAAAHRPYGLLQPLPIPKRAWASLSMDFFTYLPFVGGFDSVFFMVNRFIKMAHFAPCATTISREETSNFFFKNIVRLHGLMDDITYNTIARRTGNIAHSLLRFLKHIFFIAKFMRKKYS
jgi:hypothetical protein